MESMRKISREYAEMIKAALKEERRTVGIAEIEQGMREGLRQIGQASLEQVVTGLETTLAGEIACQCGGKLKYQRKREAQVISVFGKVIYERAYYAGCQCGEGKAPLDEELGLEPGGTTAGLGELVAQAGIGFSYEQSAKWLERYLLFDVAANTIRSETERMGEIQAEIETNWIKSSQEVSELQERERQPGVIPTRLYGSMDAAKVRIKPRPKKGR